MADAGSLFVRLGLKSQEFTRGLTKAQKDLKRTEKNVDSLGSSMRRMKTLAAAAFSGWAIARVTTDIIKLGAAFEQSMTVVGAVTRSTAREFEDLTAVARKMGEQTEWSANQAAEGLKFLGMAGLGAQRSIAALPAVLDLATAGSIDLGRAADISTNALTAMGLQTSELTRVNDVFVGTITRSNTNMDMMAESFKYAAPAAKAFGYDIEQLSAMIGILGNAGIQGSMAGTNLQMAFIRTSKAAKELGIDSNDLVEVLKEVKKQQWDATKVFEVFGRIAGKSVVALKDNIDAYETLTGALRNSKGEAKALADEMRRTLGGRWKELKSVIESIALDTFGLFKNQLKTLVEFTVYQLRIMQSEWKKIAEIITGPTTEKSALLKDAKAASADLYRARSALEDTQKGIQLWIEKPKTAAAKKFLTDWFPSKRELQAKLKGQLDEVAKFELQVLNIQKTINSLDAKPAQDDGLAEAEKATTAQVEISKKAAEAAAATKEELKKMSKDAEAMYKANLEAYEYAKESEIKIAVEAEEEISKKQTAAMKKMQGQAEAMHESNLEAHEYAAEQRLLIEEKAAKKIADAEKKYLEDRQREYEAFVQKVTDTTSDMFYDMFKGTLRDFDDFTDRMKDMFLRMIADMAAQAIARPIIVPIVQGLAGAVGGAGGIGGISGNLAAGAIGSKLTGAIGNTAIGGALGLGGAGLLGAAGQGAMALGGYAGLGGSFATAANAATWGAGGSVMAGGTTGAALGALSAALPLLAIGGLGYLGYKALNPSEPTEYYQTRAGQGGYDPSQGISMANVSTGNEEYDKYIKEKLGGTVSSLNAQLETMFASMPAAMAAEMESQFAESFGFQFGGGSNKWLASSSGTGWSEASNIRERIRERMTGSYVSSLGGMGTLSDMGYMSGMEMPLQGTDLMSRYKELSDVALGTDLRFEQFFKDMAQFRGVWDQIAPILEDTTTIADQMAAALNAVNAQFNNYADALVDIGASVEANTQLEEARARALTDIVESAVEPFTTAYENFVNTISFSDLAPVQSKEMFEARFNQLFAQAEMGDIAAYQQLLSFTEQDLLPFAQSFGGYQETFDRLLGADGLLSSMEVDLGAIGDNIGDQIADALGPLLEEKDGEMHITVDIGQQSFDEAVITTLTTNPDATDAVEEIIG